MIYADQGEYQKAIIAYEKAVRMGHPDKALLENQVARLKFHLGEKPEYSFGATVGEEEKGEKR